MGTGLYNVNILRYDNVFGDIQMEANNAMIGRLF